MSSTADRDYTSHLSFHFEVICGNQPSVRALNGAEPLCQPYSCALVAVAGSCNCRHRMRPTHVSGLLPLRALASRTAAETLRTRPSDSGRDDDPPPAT